MPSEGQGPAQPCSLALTDPSWLKVDLRVPGTPCLLPRLRSGPRGNSSLHPGPPCLLGLQRGPDVEPPPSPLPQPSARQERPSPGPPRHRGSWSHTSLPACDPCPPSSCLPASPCLSHKHFFGIKIASLGMTITVGLILSPQSKEAPGAGPGPRQASDMGCGCLEAVSHRKPCSAC